MLDVCVLTKAYALDADMFVVNIIDTKVVCGLFDRTIRNKSKAMKTQRTRYFNGPNSISTGNGF